MEWTIHSFDRRTDRDTQSNFATEAAFIMGARELLRDMRNGFEVGGPS